MKPRPRVPRDAGSCPKPFSRLSARSELILRSREVSRRPLKGHRRSAGQRLAVVLDQLRLVVPRLELADRAGAENDDHTFFALPGKCGARGAYGRAGSMTGRWAASRPSRPSRLVRAMAPSPVAVLGEKLPPIEQMRPVSGQVFGAWIVRDGSWQEEEFVAVKKHAAQRRQSVLAHHRLGVVEFAGVGLAAEGQA